MVPPLLMWPFRRHFRISGPASRCLLVPPFPAEPALLSAPRCHWLEELSLCFGGGARAVLPDAAAGGAGAGGGAPGAPKQPPRGPAPPPRQRLQPPGALGPRGGDRRHRGHPGRGQRHSHPSGRQRGPSRGPPGASPAHPLLRHRLPQLCLGGIRGGAAGAAPGRWSPGLGGRGAACGGREHQNDPQDGDQAACQEGLSLSRAPQSGGGRPWGGRIRTWVIYSVCCVLSMRSQGCHESLGHLLSRRELPLGTGGGGSGLS